MQSLRSKSDQELDMMEQQLRDARMRSNRVTRSEFEKFRPLYTRGAAEALGDHYETLAQLYRERFNLFTPIVIVEDGVDPNKSKVLLSIPPLFNNVKTFNEIPEATGVLDQLAMVFSREDNPLRTDREVATLRAMSVCDKLVDENIIKDYAQMAGPKQEVAKETKVSETDFEWE